MTSVQISVNTVFSPNCIHAIGVAFGAHPAVCMHTTSSGFAPRWGFRVRLSKLMV